MKLPMWLLNLKPTLKNEINKMNNTGNWTIEWTLHNGTKCYPNDCGKSGVVGNFTKNRRFAKTMPKGEVHRILYYSPASSSYEVIRV